ncbi:hypothetical protein [Lysinibacillus sp. SGAir0095]|uniref:hypothetical protein n=1 Tax=Lysinibacillus sp. SGAir0095 TaxID=2070463 RepID=UPI0010CD3983|nr:hypothetical protein [Lysinibacillus sp. SGAir0095]QCR33163.1 hypothetical protein C1N55_13660 [Lysinibacillus sp. SGAir0095]
MNISKVNNEIHREKACYEDMLTYARVFAECENWEGAIRSLQDAQKSIESMRNLTNCKLEITEKFEKNSFLKRITKEIKRFFLG